MANVEENESLKNGLLKSEFGNGYDSLKKEIRKVHVIPEDMRKYDKAFNPLQQQIPYHLIGNTREYLFFTKPDLNIIIPKENKLQSKLEKDIFWQDMRRRYRRVISDLQVSARRGGDYAAHDNHVFIPMLTNMVAGPLELPSSSADTTDTAQTIYGTSIQYRKSSMKSDEGYDFSLDFYDAPWLDVYHFFKMWDEYETLKDIGDVGPIENMYKKTVTKNEEYEDEKGRKRTRSVFKKVDAIKSTGYYRVNKILHDQISIYKFIVDGADMSTILYYAKLIGCFPKSVPRDAFGNFKGEGIIQYSVDWHAQFVEDMDPVILVEFNRLCQSYIGKRSNQTTTRPVVAEGKDGFHIVNNPWEGGYVKHPYIIAEPAPSYYQFAENVRINKLVWVN